MKLTCMKDDLLAAIIYTQKAVSTRTTMPILEGLLLEARDGLKLRSRLISRNLAAW